MSVGEGRGQAASWNEQWHSAACRPRRLNKKRSDAVSTVQNLIYGGGAAVSEGQGVPPFFLRVGCGVHGAGGPVGEASGEKPGGSVGEAGGKRGGSPSFHPNFF